MPKRLVDGDALWKSKKLRSVPLEIRAEYANLIPLAEADGTFEADDRRVWSAVYSFNREDVTVERVKVILEAFENVGMLIRKTDENGVVWGKFVGIDSRLPSPSQRDKYKSGNSNIFRNVENLYLNSRVPVDKVKTGLDRFGKDRFGLEQKPVRLKDAPDPFQKEADPDGMTQEQILANRDKI